MKTKSVLVLSILALFLIMSVAMVSAYTTAVVGKVYNADYTDTINNATVEVTCIHGTTPTTNSTTSFGVGDYMVQFTDNQCALNDTISVYGFKDGLSDTGDGELINVNMTSFNLALGVSNLALIPEFGFFVGALTLFSAVGVFFLVRRK